MKNLQSAEEVLIDWNHPMTTELSDKTCVPCRGGIAPLSQTEIKPLVQELDGWEVIDDHHLTKLYRFPDFATALKHVNRIGEIAEAQGHHPDIELGWGRVQVDIWTHKIDGLTESDFILAAKIDKI